MNILLIIRAEIICLVIQVFLLVYSALYNKSKNERSFLRICCWGLIHVVFDIITVYTVNHLETVPQGVNWLCHVIFFMAAIMFCYEFLNYIFRVSYPEKISKKLRIISTAVPVLYLVLIPFLEIDYLVGRGTNYSYGPCVFAGYGCTVVLFVSSVAVIIVNYTKVEKSVRRALIPMLLFMAGAVMYQIFVPEFLFTGSGVTLVTVGMYFAVENPTERYRSRAFIDLDTSVKSKNCYDEDVVTLEQKYRSSVSPKEVACVVCDLNGLKNVNDTYGHLIGDELIRLAASVLKEHLKSAYDIYRVGGDEFVAIYVDERVSRAEQEVEQVQNHSGKMHTGNGCPLSMAIGLAKSSGGDSILDVVAAADKKMYQEKSKMKGLA